MKTITRRDFLKGIAGGAGIAAVSAFTGNSALAEAPGIYTPGTYSATAQGIGTVTVTMTFDANSILDVILDVSGETPSIGQLHADELKEALMSSQSAEIDAVSGASVTSNAVKKAAEACIAQAKGEAVVLTEKAEAEDLACSSARLFRMKSWIMMWSLSEQVPRASQQQDLPSWKVQELLCCRNSL